MTRNEIFVTTYIVACINGLWGRVLIASREAGWSSVLFETDISVIVLICCGAGIWLIFEGDREEIRRSDIGVIVICMCLIILPIF